MIVALEDVASKWSAAELAEMELALQRRLASLGKVAVAFSGGVDSAVVLRAAVQALGTSAAIAMTAVSDSLADRELEAAMRVATGIGATHVLLPTGEVDDPRYTENTAARCYFCKEVVYEALCDHARAHDLGALVDGMNRDDTLEHRPGRRAAEELGVISPLFDAGLGKAEVRALARRWGLEVWDKPAMACLASRIPTGTPVTRDKLAQVESAEARLFSLGFRQVRVRHHGTVARIEVGADELAGAVDRRREIAEALRGLGFAHVSLDLEGYRAGTDTA